MVSWHWSEDPEQAGELVGIECDQAKAMSDHRRKTFRHGRHCARKALVRAGCEACALPVGDGRAPEWPTGYIGSISHTDSQALAAVASAEHLDALGVDLEERGILEESVVRLVCRADELPRLDRLGDAETAARLLFSAKEAVFKSLWPLVRRYIDFQEVALAFDLGRQNFRIGQAPTLPVDLSRRLEGRFALTSDHVVTIAYVVSSG